VTELATGDGCLAAAQFVHEMAEPGSYVSAGLGGGIGRGSWRVQGVLDGHADGGWAVEGELF
jgi:hypothetical protein